MNSLLLPRYSSRIRLAGCELPCRFVFPETASFFGSSALPSEGQEDGISVPAYEWEAWLRSGGVQDPHAEFSSFTACSSDALLEYDRMILHGVSFRFRDRAWLLCASSGVGKSTQVRFLQELYPGEFSVICGDRTILQLTEEGGVMAHPSPWNGKEGWHGAPAAPLAGILCLERGEETSFLRYTPDQAVIPVFRSLIATFSSEPLIRRIAAFETQLLRRVPVWRYVNGGVPDSTRLLYDHLCIQEA